MKSPGSFSLTVVLPTLNAAYYLREAVASIRYSYPNAFIVVADSRSTDGTLEIARELELEVEFFPPGNLYGAVNSVLCRCKTEWVAYLNADDRIESPLVPSREVDILYGNQRFIDDSGTGIYGWRMAEPSAFKALLAGGVMPIYFQGTLIRREFFNALSGFDTFFRFSADFDFVMRAHMAGARFRHECRIAGAFRLHEHQLSQSKGSLMREEVLASVRRAGVKVPFPARFAALLFLRLRNIRGLRDRWMAHRSVGGRGVPKTIEVFVGRARPK